MEANLAGSCPEHASLSRDEKRTILTASRTRVFMDAYTINRLEISLPLNNLTSSYIDDRLRTVSAHPQTGADTAVNANTGAQKWGDPAREKDSRGSTREIGGRKRHSGRTNEITDVVNRHDHDDGAVRRRFVSCWDEMCPQAAQQKPTPPDFPC
jgi:hypothetical protein